MSGRPQLVAAVLRVVADPAPAAYYACNLCPYTASRKGRRAVQEWVPTIRSAHRAACPNLERTSA